MTNSTLIYIHQCHSWHMLLYPLRNGANKSENFSFQPSLNLTDRWGHSDRLSYSFVLLYCEIVGVSVRDANIALIPDWLMVGHFVFDHPHENAAIQKISRKFQTTPCFTLNKCLINFANFWTTKEQAIFMLFSIFN